MPTRQPRYSKEEHARRGEELYERLADDVLTASERLLARYPDAQVWCVRVGHRAVHRFGSQATGTA